MKAYEKFRQEHVAALTKLVELQKGFAASEKTRMDREEEYTALSRRLEESEKNNQALSSKVEGDAVAVDELRSQLAKADIDMEDLRWNIENLKAAHKSKLVTASIIVLLILLLFFIGYIIARVVLAKKKNGGGGVGGWVGLPIDNRQMLPFDAKQMLEYLQAASRPTSTTPSIQ